VWWNGLGGRAAAGNPVLVALAEAGYFVIAPNVPEIFAPVSWAGGYVEQPADVQLAIDSLLDPSDGVAGPLLLLIYGDEDNISPVEPGQRFLESAVGQRIS